MNQGSRLFGFRAASYSAAVFFAVGIYIPFFPVWLKTRGLTESQVTMILAAPLYARAILSPLLTVIVDQFGSLGRGAAVYGLLATGAFLLMGQVDGFFPILLLGGAAMVFWHTLVPIGDAAIIHGVKHAGLDYSRTRLWGSASFIVANLLSGVAAAKLGTDVVYPLLAIAFGMGALVAFGLPHIPPIQKGNSLADATLALRDKTLRTALIAGALIGSAHAGVYAFGTLFWTERGFSPIFIGVLWSVGVVAEIVLFYFATHLKGFGARRFLIIGGAAAVMRWLAFPFATHPASAFLLQCLHGLTFASAHLGVMMAIGAVSLPGHTARLQAGYQFLGGILLATAMLITGPLFSVSPIVVFWLMAGFGLGGLIFALRLERGLQPKQSHDS